MFVFIVSIFGFMFIIRILQELSQKKILHSSLLTKIGTILFLFFVIVVRMIPLEEYLLGCLFIISCLIINLLRIFVCRIRERRFKDHLVEVLDSIILNMTSGFSFRESFRRTLVDRVAPLKQQLEQIYAVVVFSQHESMSAQGSLVEEVTAEFTRIERNSHRSISRLRELRRKYKIEQDFRRRSGKALMQIHVQAGFLSLMFVVLLVVVVCQRGLLRVFPIVGISTVLFLIGLIWIIYGGRRYRWKV